MNLLSPPIPVDHTGSDSHLISYGPVMNVVLTGISSVDCVQVFSYHGLVGIHLIGHMNIFTLKLLGTFFCKHYLHFYD